MRPQRARHAFNGFKSSECDLVDSQGRVNVIGTFGQVKVVIQIMIPPDIDGQISIERPHLMDPCNKNIVKDLTKLIRSAVS